MQVESRHEAANAYAEAGHAYKKTSSKGNNELGWFFEKVHANIAALTY